MRKWLSCRVSFESVVAPKNTNNAAEKTLVPRDRQKIIKRKSRTFIKLNVTRTLKPHERRKKERLGNTKLKEIESLIPAVPQV